MHTYVIDSTNTTRLVKRCFIIDSGNVSRQVKKIWVIDSTNTARLVYTSTKTFTMVAGQETADGHLFIGYLAGSYGSLSPTTDPEGNTISGIVFAASAGTLTLQINVATNPGSIYVQTLTIAPGQTYIGPAATYSYGSGVATWEWASTALYADGDTYTVTLGL